MKCGPKTRPLIDRFNDKWIPEPNSGCWLWTGADNGSGYGVIGLRGKYGRQLYAHRVSYEYFKGKIPEGLTIDHLCRTRCCVNPKHLEAVTQRINNLRGTGMSAIHAKKTHCPKGHPYSGSNLIMDQGSRRCRICRKEQDKQDYIKNGDSKREKSRKCYWNNVEARREKARRYYYTRKEQVAAL